MNIFKSLHAPSPYMRSSNMRRGVLYFKCQISVFVIWLLTLFVRKKKKILNISINRSVYLILKDQFISHGFIVDMSHCLFDGETYKFNYHNTVPQYFSFCERNYCKLCSYQPNYLLLPKSNSMIFW